MSDIVLITGKVLIDVSDIKSMRGLQYSGPEDYYLSDKYIVRVFSRTPFIDLVCDDLESAQELYKKILKTRQVVNINEMRY